MKTYRNIKGIEKKEQRGRRLSMIGLGVLMIGLFASFVPTWLPPDEPAATPLTQMLQQYWMWISFVALPVGFIFASVGSYYINRYARRRWKGSKEFARPDEVVERSLKGFDNKYSYFAWSLPAHYVIAGPCGIIVLAARSDKGRITVKGDKWSEPFSIGRIFTIFAREGLGNPAKEVNDQAAKLTAILTGCAANGEKSSNGAELDGAEGVTQKATPDIPIIGAAVFLNPDAQLTVENPSMPVLRADQLKEYIRRQAREVKLPASTVRTMTECLAEAADYSEEE